MALNRLLVFNPAINADDFSAAFTAAEGWGSYAQQRTPQSFQCSYAVHYGEVKLSTVKCVVANGHHPTKATVKTAGGSVGGKLTVTAGECIITIDKAVALKAGQQLVIHLV